MINDYGQDTYKILSKLTKITFSKYLKDSGIKLEAIYQMKDLKTEREFYLLEVNSIQIRFKTQRDFIFHFLKFLKKNIEYYDKRYRELTNRQIAEFTDEIGIEMEYKQIDYFRMQQKKLLQLLKTIYDKSCNI